MLRQAAISLLFAALALPAVARTRPHYGGTLRVEIAGDPWQRPGGLARRLVFDGLTALDANGAVRPALAVAWAADGEDHRWEFQLRPDVSFQDGTPLTAEAVAASLTASCNANCPWSAVHAVGASVVFTGDAPMPNLPALLAGDDFLIALTITPDGKPVSVPIGTGPFQVTSFSNGVLALAANENCWQGRPFADSIQILTDRSVRDQWLDLAVGRADVVEVPAELLRAAREQQLTVIASPPVALLALQLSEFGALQNPSLRASIAQAVDRDALCNVIFQKNCQATASLLPQSLTGYSFLFPTGRDIAKAQQLRGGSMPPPLNLSVAGDGAMLLAAQRIALNLRDAGFNVRVTGANSAQPADLTLRKLPLEGGSPAAALEALLRAAGNQTPVARQSPAGLFNAERTFLDLHTLVPLLDLPRAVAVSGRVRDLRLLPDGAPDLASASLEDAP